MDSSRKLLFVSKDKVIYVTCFVTLSLFIFSCRSTKKNIPSTIVFASDSVKMDTVFVEEKYNPTPTKFWDLLNTKLDVSFDWNNCFLIGKASLHLKPHFYACASVQIDAVGFTLNDVSMITGNIKTKLKYQYDGKVINITLPKQVTSSESVILYIDYIAKPNELRVVGSNAILSDKGLYFINPQATERYKPQQIWTQGETQASSCWFPTIDAPNQKMTQEISITVDKKFKTLSNGLLIWQQLNSDSTRTDIWKQALPASPYLTMMAIGQFAEIKDSWNNLEVSYLLEPAYAPFAKQIFGNTPEMMTYFSKIFGVTYPWEKYTQVVVRDYVSGAMENTSATLHGEFIQRTDRELLDENSEDFIAHELAHQWFGDFVTSESWSNLVLNEGFATYGEYLWLKHKYGNDEADYHLYSDLQSYLNEASRKQEDLVRFNYDDKEDMFDSHSYAKGGRVLHMLRNVVGDDAFFASLKYYLEKNKFKTVEAHDLRMAFEEITGRDLNWFFNQWFFASGHPSLTINYAYNDTTKKQSVIIEQLQNQETNLLYTLPIRIDVYNKSKVDTHYVVIQKKKEVFVFDSPFKPEFVNVDAEKVLVCEKKDNKSISEWSSQYLRSTHYIDKIEALAGLEVNFNEQGVVEVFAKAMLDKNWHIRTYAVGISGEHAREYSGLLKPILIKLAQKDERSNVRAAAIDALSHSFDDKDLLNIYKRAIDDASYLVEGEALRAIFRVDNMLGVEFANTFETDSAKAIVLSLCSIYSQAGEERDNEYFLKAFYWLHGAEKYDFCKSYSTYLLNRSDSTINKSLSVFERIATTENAWYIRLAGYNALELLKDLYISKKKETQESIKRVQQKNSKPIEIANLEKQLDVVEKQLAHFSSVLRTIKSKETDKNLIQIYGKLD